MIKEMATVGHSCKQKAHSKYYKIFKNVKCKGNTKMKYTLDESPFNTVQENGRIFFFWFWNFVTKYNKIKLSMAWHFVQNIIRHMFKLLKAFVDLGVLHVTALSVLSGEKTYVTSLL